MADFSYFVCSVSFINWMNRKNSKLNCNQSIFPQKSKFLNWSYNFLKRNKQRLVHRIIKWILCSKEEKSIPKRLSSHNGITTEIQERYGREKTLPAWSTCSFVYMLSTAFRKIGRTYTHWEFREFAPHFSDLHSLDSVRGKAKKNYRTCVIHSASQLKWDFFSNRKKENYQKMHFRVH